MTTKTVFISGAAQGIGRATAEKLMVRGWTVGAYDLKDVENAPEGLITGHLDVTDPESWDAALADFATRAGGEIRAVVNNAGILYGGPFMTEGSFDKDSALVDVNVKGVLFGSRAAYPWLKKVEDARLVNLASAAAIYGQPDMAVYSATKFAVRGITEALDLEWDADDITVTDLMPLFAKTGMLDGVSTTGTSRMGVRLSAEDVARNVADVVEAPRHTPTWVHHPVGLQAKLLYHLSNFAPGWLRRFLNAKLTSNRNVRL